jgi:uncharacterized membrane protein
MTVVSASIAFGYPFIISAGVALGRPGLVAVLLSLLLLTPAGLAWWWSRPGEALSYLVQGCLVMLCVTLAALTNEARLIRLGPAVANVAMLFSFGRTLRKGPSMVETFARLRHRHLPHEAVGYCRRLTLLWCMFFALNGAFIVWLALYASIAWWTIYTGCLAYLLAAALFLAELLYRRRRFAVVERGSPTG